MFTYYLTPFKFVTIPCILISHHRLLQAECIEVNVCNSVYMLTPHFEFTSKLAKRSQFYVLITHSSSPICRN